MKWFRKIFGSIKSKDPMDFEKKIIFIVGLYKCGTSWLSLALGKHPTAMALPELDVIRAFANESVANLEAKTIEERIKYIFSASNYGRLPVVVTENAVQVPKNNMFDYFEKNASKRIYIKNAFTAQQFDRDKALQRVGQGCSLNIYMTYWDFDKDSAKKLFEDAILNTDTKNAIRNFCQIHQSFSGEFLVLKSADQINHFKQLKNVMPNSPRLLIIRDGRDMAISASKFEKYIKEKTHFGVIWKFTECSFWTRLEQWANVVRLVDNYRKQGEIYLLSYENLSNDFEGTFTKLLDWLGLDSSSKIVQQIKSETSFEKMSGGRGKGNEDISSTIRKGITGEWRSVLSDEDKEKAWNIAGKELAMFGYKKF